MLEELKNWVSKHRAIQVLIAFWMVLSPFGGYFASEFFSVRAQERAALNTDYIATQQASLMIQKHLLQLAAVANGREQKSDAEVANMRQDFETLYAASSQVQRRLPAITPDFDAYAHSMVELQDAAEHLSDPTDAPHFTEVVDRYLMAQNAFNVDVTGAQTCYWRCLFGYSPPKHPA